jgi:hypothetical protein
MNGSVGSVGVAGWIAQICFWVLIGLGIAYGDVRKKTAAGFVALWLLGCFGIPRIAWWAGSLVISWVAALDIALVFIVFKGDVRV